MLLKVRPAHTGSAARVFVRVCVAQLAVWDTLPMHTCTHTHRNALNMRFAHTVDTTRDTMRTFHTFTHTAHTLRAHCIHYSIHLHTSGGVIAVPVPSEAVGASGGGGENSSIGEV